MKNIPTDIEILEAIFEKYYPAFLELSPLETGERRSPFFPIDIRQIAEGFDVDPDIVFARLYYHLENKYKYDKVSLFQLQIGGKQNAVHLPYLSSILADLRVEDKRHRWSLILSLISVVVAALSFLLSTVSVIIAKS